MSIIREEFYSVLVQDAVRKGVVAALTQISEDAQAGTVPPEAVADAIALGVLKNLNDILPLGLDAAFAAVSNTVVNNQEEPQHE